MSVVINRKGGAGGMSDAEIMAAVKRLDGPGSGLDADTLRGELPSAFAPTLAGLPAGAVLWFLADEPPAGWLECDGAAVSRSTYTALFTVLGTVFGAGDGETTYALPDLRGEFVRGWDHGRGIDLDRSFGSHQNDLLGNHNHTSFFVSSSAASKTIATGTDRGNHMLTDGNYTGNTGGFETRPRNVNLLPCIKY